LPYFRAVVKGNAMTPSTERAILAGGCFWGMQDLIRKMHGVLSTRVGYSGGDVPNATYRNHGTHAEAIEIVFDPNVMSYRTLLEFFFQIHDPTTRNRQGNDTGMSYRSGFITRVPNRRGLLKTLSRMSGVGALAGQGRNGSRARWSVLGSRARTPTLSGKISRRVHLPFRPLQLETSASGRSSQGKLGHVLQLVLIPKRLLSPSSASNQTDSVSE
jgi:peptide-methionine (S)-S-oxide reductase